MWNVFSFSTLTLALALLAQSVSASDSDLAWKTSVGILGGESLIGGAYGFRPTIALETHHRVTNDNALGLYARYTRPETTTENSGFTDRYVNLTVIAGNWEHFWNTTAFAFHSGIKAGLGIISFHAIDRWDGSTLAKSDPVLILGPGGGMDYAIAKNTSFGVEANLLWISGDSYAASTDLLGAVRYRW